MSENYPQSETGNAPHQGNVHALFRDEMFFFRSVAQLAEDPIEIGQVAEADAEGDA